MTENKTPTGDFIKLNRQDYEIILQWAHDIDDLQPREKETQQKVQKILLNIQKFNANKRL